VKLAGDWGQHFSLWVWELITQRSRVLAILGCPQLALWLSENHLVKGRRNIAMRCSQTSCTRCI